MGDRMTDPFQLDKVLVPVALAHSENQCKVHLNLIFTGAGNLWWPVPQLGLN